MRSRHLGERRRGTHSPGYACIILLLQQYAAHKDKDCFRGVLVPILAEIGQLVEKDIRIRQKSSRTRNDLVKEFLKPAWRRQAQR